MVSIEEHQKLIDEVRRTDAVIKRLTEALGALGNAADKVSRERAVIQPFLSVWKKYGKEIEDARDALPPEDGR